MSKLEFTPEDLAPLRGAVVDDVMLQTATNLVNARLAEMLAEAPVVHLRMAGPKSDLPVSIYVVKHGTTTHRARLVNVEPIGSIDAESEDDEPRLVWCDRCNGLGVVDCCCGGDLCICLNNGERTCRQCGGDGECLLGEFDAE